VILVLSQVYRPDPAAVGQYLAWSAEALVERGFAARAITSSRGFDDPTQRYPLRETLDGVDVVRLPLSSFGKKSIPLRLLGMAFFLPQAILRGLFTPNLAAILVSTSPPLASLAALVIGFLRRVPITYWVMDLNPDQMIALGKVRETSLAARVFDVFNRMILRRASAVVALDRFMAERLNKKLDVSHKLTVMPPWPHNESHEGQAGPVEHADNPFRREHGLDRKFVVMYSGNHAFTNPIATVLEAALRMQDREDLVFAFVGGGVRKKEVDAAIQQHRPPNVLSLPYQPLEQTRYSLSAADVHLVTLGDEVVGIVHPCKVYGALALGRPILYVGPHPSHVSDLIDEHRVGWSIDHGDVEEAIRTIDAIRQTPPEELREMGQRALRLIAERFDERQMIDEFCDVVTRDIPLPSEEKGIRG
jgi:glycosyltransferase involved in cell wall biosynthesis